MKTVEILLYLLILDYTSLQSQISIKQLIVKSPRYHSFYFSSTENFKKHFTSAMNPARVFD
ncbi:MAG: hypothetical protein ACXAC2_25960, partial [Candidatus Kariarchaeaceae archaeon]